MVRLGVCSSVSSLEPWFSFQFQYGAIRSIVQTFAENDCVVFQFQYGAIRRELKVRQLLEK